MSVDLTKRRLNLLNYARDQLKSGNYPNFKYVFADINCSLAVRDVNDELCYFNSKQQLHDVIGGGVVADPEIDE